jgi:hypothetical protein
MMNRGDNVIDFPARVTRAISEESAARSARQQSHLDGAEEVLQELRKKKPLVATDKLPLVRNLGRQIGRLNPTNPKALAKRILGDKWEKRKRYVLFEEERDSGRFAASGDCFSVPFGAEAAPAQMLLEQVRCPRLLDNVGGNSLSRRWHTQHDWPLRALLSICQLRTVIAFNDDEVCCSTALTDRDRFRVLGRVVALTRCCVVFKLDDCWLIQL